jgi:multidrug efflux pump subunit AcrA (membrane-fusion protein)
LAAAVSFAVASNEGSIGNVLLPLSALVKRTDGTYVFILKTDTSVHPQGIVSLRKVSLGDLTSDGVQVLAGVKPGELVVTAGVSFLQDEQLVAMPKSD